MSISEVTRRNLLDFLILKEPPFFGRLNLITFLKRIWNLSAMPSNDDRFEKAEDDIRQHMVNNFDWSYAELLYDRLDLLNCDEETFLRFLEECTHPIVIGDEDHRAELVSFINKNIEPDGYRLIQVREVSGQPIYKAERPKAGSRVDAHGEGAAAPAVIKTVNCPRCSQELRATAKFCDNCGLSLVSDAASTIIVEEEDTSNTSDPNSAADSIVGLNLESKYEIIEQLGAGGMGRVYLARRTRIGDEVVIKFLNKRYVANEVAVERFRREAQAAARIKHPNVVVVHDYGEADGGDAPAFIVMEYVQGESLRRLLVREGRMIPDRAVQLMREVCRGVGAAHQIGVIHRDIKPDNIIVLAADDEGREAVKVVDFGLAKLRDETGDPTVTQLGVALGTPLYMSPEQCRGEILDARSDVYSLGVLMYELLSGATPFIANNFAAVSAKHQYEPPPPFPPDLRIPPTLEAVIMRSLAKSAADRQQDAAEFSRELQGAVREDDDRLRAQAEDAETLTERPVEVSKGVVKAIANLTETDSLILRLSCESAIEQGYKEQIEVKGILDKTAGLGVAREDTLEALEILDGRGYIEPHKVFGGDFPFNIYAITTFGFQEYAKAYVEDYNALVDEVIVQIVRHEKEDNFSIREALSQQQLLVDHILDVLERNGFVKLSKTLGGGVKVYGVSAELKRRVKAAAEPKDVEVRLQPCIKSHGDIFNLCFVLSNEGDEDIELLEVEAAVPKHLLNPNWSRDFDRNVVEKLERNIDGKAHLVFRYKVYEGPINRYFGDIERLPRIVSPSMDERVLSDFWFALRKDLSDEERAETIKFKVTAKGVQTEWQTVQLGEALERRCNE
jgi:serine/threonine protein kinase